MSIDTLRKYVLFTIKLGCWRAVFFRWLYVLAALEVAGTLQICRSTHQMIVILETMKPLINELNNPMNSTIGKVLLNELLLAPWESLVSRNIEDAGISYGTYVGKKRSRNEDRLAVAYVTTRAGEQFSIAVVCDGVGGSEMGDSAATLAIAILIDALTQSPPKIPLYKLLSDLIRKVDDRVRESLKGRGLTTISVLLGSSNGGVVATNVGDSRVFKWSPTRSSLTQVSIDDTMDNEFKRFAVKDNSILDARGLRGTLSQAIGEIGRTSSELHLSIQVMNDFEGEGAILASDGAWKGDEFGFISIAKNAISASESMKRILALSTWTGGIDNVSIIALNNLSIFAKSCDDATRRNSNSSWATVWICDTKLIISDNSKALNGPRRKINSSSNAGESEVFSERVRRKSEKKYVAGAQERNTRQLEFIEELQVEKIGGVESNPTTIEISTDKEFEKLQKK